MTKSIRERFESEAAIEVFGKKDAPLVDRATWWVKSWKEWESNEITFPHDVKAGEAIPEHVREKIGYFNHVILANKVRFKSPEDKLYVQLSIDTTNSGS